MKYEEYEVNGLRLRFELSNHTWLVFTEVSGQGFIKLVRRLSEAKGKAIMKFLDDVKEVQNNDTNFKE